jgi:hypothetical protein
MVSEVTASNVGTFHVSSLAVYRIVATIAAAEGVRLDALGRFA